MITIPDNFASYTISRAGDTGRQWIERLPGLFATTCAQWNLRKEGEPMHGGLSVVVPVKRGNMPCILKLGWVDESTAQEALALTAWDGNGAVKLLAANPEDGVMLLERLDNTRTLNDVPVTEAVTLAGQLLRRLAIPAPKEITSLSEVTKRLAQALPARWEQAGRPFSRQILDQACTLATESGPASGNLLVNYDLIYADILASEREPWLAVDPKVVAGDLEYGIAQLLWRRLEEIEAQGGLDRHFQIVTEAANLDTDLSRSWTFVRCVDYWLWGCSIGLTEDPARCEVIIRWLVG